MRQFEIMPRPPKKRDISTPWPTWPLQFSESSAHEEGGERVFSISTKEFIDDGSGHVAALTTQSVESKSAGWRPYFKPFRDTEEKVKADLVLLALGFTGPERGPMLDQFGIELTSGGNVDRDDHWATSAEGVFVAGDMGRGQSLIVWAIAEGRAAAASIDEWLMGETLLPSPLSPRAKPLA